ncbi:MAG: hypothetical protein ACE5DI_02355 [Candidatus Micrarchaeia archaeon]
MSEHEASIEDYVKMQEYRRAKAPTLAKAANALFEEPKKKA